MTTIAQISDVHVRPRGILYQDAVDSNRMLASAITCLNHLSPAPDLVMITGDLTDEGHPDEYAMLRELLAALRLPFIVLPGNHDDRSHLRAAFGDHRYLPHDGPLHYTMTIGDVTVIALDTSVPQLHHGELSTASLEWFDRALTECRGRPALVAMHHPPFATGIPYLDIYGMRDTAAFADVLQTHDHVDRVVVGHVHRSMQTRIGRVPVLSCPSTVTQIALRTQVDASPASYLEPPAFFLHRWVGQQPAVSHLHYIDRYDGPFPFA